MTDNPSWQPTHDDPLFILAMDHRASFGLETVEAAQQVAEQARAGGRSTDLIVLGRDAPAERLDHWLEVASQVRAFVGFAIGRSIWEDAVRGYEASDRGEAAASAARAQIAERYVDFFAQWKP